MISLTPEQARAFADAVRLAMKSPVRQAVEVVYESLQDAIDLRQPICSASGRCCRFEEYGHRLFVTTLEMAAFASQAARELTPDSWDGTGCPFQLGGLCDVHPIRPLGCRIYFCDSTSTDWQTQQYERFHAHLKRLHESMEIPYFYVEWRQALAAIAGSP
jgi:Fe-S-cluster containining protein